MAYVVSLNKIVNHYSFGYSSKARFSTQVSNIYTECQLQGSICTMIPSYHLINYHHYYTKLYVQHVFRK